MKKFFLITLFSLISIFNVISFTGCGNNSKESQSFIENDKGYIINNDFSMDKMKTISGNSFNIENDERIVFQTDIGIGIRFTDEVHNFLEEGKMGGYVIRPYSMGVSYFIGENESADILGLWRYEEGAEGIEESFEIWKGLYSDVEEIAEIDNNKYYFGYNKNLDLKNIEKSQAEDINLVISQIDEIKKNICIFTPESKNFTKTISALKDFEVNTLNGETITQDIFSNYDITMINIWATWCTPCIAELPEIAELYKDKPENVNIISICTDAIGNEDFAKEILSESNAEFMTLIPSEELERDFLSNITSIPYTLFVNSKGEVVGEPQIGAPPANKVKETYSNIINERLEMIKDSE